MSPDDPCMRWSPGRVQSWRRRRDGGFDADLYYVDEIRTGLAKPFVTATHYSGTFPSDRRNYGLFEIASSRLVGVAVLSTPTSPKTIPATFPGLPVHRQQPRAASTPSGPKSHDHP